MNTLSGTLKQHSRFSLILRIAIVSAFVAMIAVFSFLDLEFSQLVYGRNNPAGEIFSYTFFIVGFLPAILVDVLLFAIAFHKVKNKILKVIFVILVASSLFGAFYTCFMDFEGIPSAVKYGVPGGIAPIGTFLILWGLSKVKKENLDKLFYITLISAILATISIVVVALLQFTYGRDRYFTLLPDYPGAVLGHYTPWYLPQGPSSNYPDFNSFPSMHASSSFSMTFLVLLAWRFKMPKWAKITLSTVAFTMIFCISFSRVVMGWHYMSDILFGLLISYGAGEAALAVTDRLIFPRLKLGNPTEMAENNAELPQ